MENDGEDEKVKKERNILRTIKGRKEDNTVLFTSYAGTAFSDSLLKNNYKGK
jgi:hypothetical protein